MNQDKISVIIPVYNAEQYLARCITSVVTQTYQNLEIIIVNDGSTDNSKTVIADFQRTDKRIRVVNKKNGGVASARNLGLEYATGEYVSWVDSDDYIAASYMFESMVAKMKKENADCCICNFYLGTVDGTKWQPYIGIDCSNSMGGQDLLEALLEDKTFKAYMWNKMFNLKLYQGLSFENRTVLEDWIMLERLFERVNCGCVIDAPLYCYNQCNENSLTRIRGDLHIYRDVYEISRDTYYKYRDRFTQIHMKMYTAWMYSAISYAMVSKDENPREDVKNELLEFVKCVSIPITKKVKALGIVVCPRLIQWLRVKLHR